MADDSFNIYHVGCMWEISGFLRKLPEGASEIHGSSK